MQTPDLRDTTNQGLTVGALVFGAFMIFGLFPYVKLAPLASDVQPYFVVMAVTYALLFPVHLRQSGITVLLLLGTAYLIGLFAIEFDIALIRGAFNYLTPVLGALVIYSHLRTRTDTSFLATWALVAMAVYVVVGQLQVLFGVNVIGPLINVRTADVRGVTSLTSEPNFFGTMGFLLLVLVALNGTRRQIIIAFVMLSMINLIYIVSPISYFLYLLTILYILVAVLGVRRRVVLQISGTVLVLIAVFLTSGLSEQAIMALGLPFRVERVAVAMTQLDFNLLFLDASASGRFASIFMAFLGAFENSFLPTAPGSFYDFYNDTIRFYRDIFPHGNPTERPMSGFGTYVYDFGLVGIVVTVIFIRNIMVLTGGEPFLTGGLVFTFLFVVPMSHPFSGILLGLAFLAAHRSEGWAGAGDAEPVPVDYTP